MPRPVLAYWYAKLPNFGNLLTPFYIQRLTGRRVINLMHADRGPKLRRYKEYSCVGSILGRGDWDASRATVWGSGFLFPPGVPLVKPRELLCVRGERSLDLYDKDSRAEVQAVGDPGLLIADFFPERLQPKHDIGLVAHYCQKNHPFLNEAWQAGIKVIDIQQSVVSFVDELRDCSIILSSAMHALIAADSFGIPNRWVGFGQNLMNERFKFHDYFSVAAGYQEKPDLVLSMREMRASARDARARSIQTLKADLWATNPFTHLDR